MSNLAQEKLKLVLYVGDALAQGEQHGNVQLVPGGPYKEDFYAVKQLHVQDIMDIAGIRHSQTARQCMDSLIAEGVFQVHTVTPDTPGYYSIRLADKGQQLYEKEKQRLSSP